MNENILYKSDEIEEFYKRNRTKWEDFYPSERYIFETINFDSKTTVLDIGCGCGGLGNALKNKYGVINYSGIDINKKAISTGKKLFPELNLRSGDILDSKAIGVEPSSFDIVVSLGCIDWNVEFDKMLSVAISCLKFNGKFISSFRLTEYKSLFSIRDSFQHINFSNKKEGEKAPYVVMTFDKLKKKLLQYSPKHIHAFGYIGKPSQTAVTPYENVCFSVMAITKGPADSCSFKLELPQHILNN